ncbi:type I restriction-modification system endonuclease [Zobellella denitrificans]|uniref:type I restriction-modification system endonuclease n=1 Tax=Zobellella denitrificans TaxID=347534 RepID=UPI000B8BD5C5|nr:type I restriction-modification system endonuclease [Zobellella denitrificans]OXS15706.1 type I restriction-modification system endonuclease [Zobellella denitrificans]
MEHNSNFDFLSEHDPLFLQLARAAEQAFAGDPNTTLIKLRQLGEALARNMAARIGLELEERTTQADLLYRLSRELGLDPSVRQMFHVLRVEGNRATHEFHTRHKEAMDALKLARELAVWFHRAFGAEGDGFRPGAFMPPADPSAELRQLKAQITQLNAQLEGASEQLENQQQEAEKQQQLAELMARESAEHAELASLMDQEARAMAELARQHEQELARQQAAFEARLKAELQQQAEQSKAVAEVSRRTQQASKQLNLSEEETRVLIDMQLLEAGWEADTEQLTWANGTRPEKGKNLAIAEWPTQGKAPADYVLFAGLTPIAVVEAKRKNLDVAGKIHQAERYSRGLQMEQSWQAPWALAGLPQPWRDGNGHSFQVPFVYSCNGRPFVKQLAEKSGTWFRDARAAANLARPLQQFHSPQGLLDLLTRSQSEAEAQLAQEPYGYLKLRDYQQKAIESVEQALARGQRHCLLAMATGTGKTRTIIGLMYRFLKAERFKRILFLVDRTALGEQAQNAFDDMPLEQNFTLSKIYNVAELGDMAAESETRIQVATVQAMVKRVFQSDNPPAIDDYDCIIIDEAHRGYTLDQEMSEGELATRDASQYLSSYRRVLDYFDAVRIGLTATPARHTSEIFGRPVYTYSYREAVADDWLIDHEPPIRYETLLSQEGIHLAKGEQVEVINTHTGEVELAELEDEQHFEVEAFNRRVIAEDFNRVICRQLAKELDPLGDEKTMIFCATDLHADMVKRLLDEAFKEQYEEAYNEAAVRKITGQSDKVGTLIRQYKNERYPNIAITVDLLTTGIDVPPICHLVFLRRVKSRILFEQMLGRATRRCDDIGKTVFKIYDPVDIYATLQEVNSMQPLVKDPNISLDQLVSELTDDHLMEQALSAPGTLAGQSHADDLLNALCQKVMRITRKAASKAETRPELKQKLTELGDQWGTEADKLHQHLHELGPAGAAGFMRRHGNLLSALAEVKDLLGSERNPVIYAGSDEFRARTQSYGVHEKPADYLDSFDDFIRQQLNQSVALGVVVNRPKDLTREQLKEVRLLLDAHGYSEASLNSAWSNQSNQDIAASIIGHIRRAAMREELVPFAERVSRAMAHIYNHHDWTPKQRKWLDRLAKQLTHEVVIDEQFINQAFARDGGAKVLDKQLDNQLKTVLSELAEQLWQVA